MKNQYTIGIDIGGTATKFGVVDADGLIIEHNKISTTNYSLVELFVEELYQVMMPMIDNVGGKENIIGIGVGAPNGNVYTGAIEYAPNLKWEGVIPLAGLIENKFGLPTKLTNDANAAAMGEMLYGCAKHMKHFIMITLGTGVGSGIVIDGKMVVGNDGFAGELGHNVVVPGGRLHKGTGFRGSLESYVSATGVRETALELLSHYADWPSSIRTYKSEELNSQIVYECAIKGDPIAKEVFEFTGEILGKALSNFVMFSSPEAIVLFGGLSKAGDLLLKPTQKHMEENLLPIFKNKVKVMFSMLNESDAAILGASALVME